MIEEKGLFPGAKMFQFRANKEPFWSSLFPLVAFLHFLTPAFQVKSPFLQFIAACLHLNTASLQP